MVTTTGFVRCLCQHKYGDNSNCPRHGSPMSRTSPLSLPSYTLAELKLLMREFADADDDFKVTRQIILSAFTLWLAKREQEEESNNVD